MGVKLLYMNFYVLYGENMHGGCDSYQVAHHCNDMTDIAIQVPESLIGY